MSDGFASLKIEEFRLAVLDDYRGIGVLNGTTMEKHGIKGESYQIPVTEPITMQDLPAVCSHLPSQDIVYNKPKLFLNNKFIKVCTDVFTDTEAGFEELPAVIRQFKDAIGREQDQQKINALDDSAGTAIPDGGSNMSVVKLIEAGKLLDDQSVPPEDRIVILTGSQKEALLREDKFTNSDFATKALERGNIENITFMGFRFITIGANRDALEGGLPLAGNIRTCFVWHKMSTWAGWGIDPRIKVDEIPGEIHQTALGYMRLGAKVALDKGVVKIDCDES